MSYQETTWMANEDLMVIIIFSVNNVFVNKTIAAVLTDAS